MLDNAHGNVYFGVANGTACTMHSLAWDDPEDKKDAHNAIKTSTPGQVIDLPKPAMGCWAYQVKVEEQNKRSFICSLKVLIDY